MTDELKTRLAQIAQGIVPTGYRKTKVGIVPEEWEVVHFTDLFTSTSNYTDDLSQYPLYSLTIEQGIVAKTERYERSHLVKKDNAYKVVEPNDYAFNPMNIRFGAVARHKGNITVAVSGYYDIFTTVHTSDLLFMDSFLTSFNMIAHYNRVSTGSILEKQRVHFSQFLDFMLPLPSLQEREKIAQILTTQDKVIQLKEKLLEQKKQQKKYLMQQLLTVKKRLEGFCGEWVEVTFDDLFTFFGSLGKSRAELSKNGIPYLHYGDMHKSNMLMVSINDYNKLPRYEIELTGNEKYLMSDGDVVFLDASEDLEGTARSVVVDNPNNEPFIAGLHTILAKSKNEKLLKEYKKFITVPYEVKKQFMVKATGSKVSAINKTTIKQIQILLPPLPEQEAIAKILTTADKELDLLQKDLDQEKRKKKSLMQLLLTGIVRVKP